MLLFWARHAQGMLLFWARHAKGTLLFEPGTPWVCYYLEPGISRLVKNRKQIYLCVGYFDEQTSFHIHRHLKFLRLFGEQSPILDPPWPWIQQPAHGLCQLNQNQVEYPIFHTNTFLLHWCMFDLLEIFSFLPNHRVFWLEKFLLVHLQRLQ